MSAPSAVLSALAERLRDANASRRALCLRGSGSKDFYGEPPRGDQLDLRGLDGSCEHEPTVQDGRTVCHVSLLVTSISGVRVVIDNGNVLDPATTGGVAAYAQFAALVDRHWVGRKPDGVSMVAGGRRHPLS